MRHAWRGESCEEGESCDEDVSIPCLRDGVPSASITHSQRRGLRERLAAVDMLAHKRLLAGVGALVGLAVGALAEAFVAALGADVGLVASVRALVRRDLALGGEALFADGAFETLVARVGPLVPGLVA